MVESATDVLIIKVDVVSILRERTVKGTKIESIVEKL